MGELNVFRNSRSCLTASKISESYGVHGLPTSFIIDREGRLVFKAVGGREFDHPEVVALIRDLLAQPSKP
jgi:hypothetical protein